MHRVAWSLGHRPALDGLRAVAVLAVVAHHVGILPAGYVGVDVFFALSGFLITTLLLEEHASTGRIALGRFWVRRAHRLFPALLAVVAFTVGFGALVGFGSNWVSWLTALGAITYVTNFLLLDSHYSVLTHTWSLAIEEQFYLTWPLVLLIVLHRGRRAVVGVASLLAVAAAIWAHLLVGDERARVAFSFDARVAPILAGCALAAWMGGQRLGPTRLWAVAVAAGGLAVLAVFPDFLADWRIAAASATSVLLLWGVVAGNGFPPLQHSALTWLGRRSYGIYLWHVPVLTIADEALPWSDIGTGAIALVMTIAIAAISYTFVEEPVLRRHRRTVRSLPAQGANSRSMPV